MRHEQVIDNLSAYIEETLDPAMRAAVEHHIGECADCYRELATLRSVYKLLDSPLAQVEPPPVFHDNVMRRIRVQVHAQQKIRAKGWASRLGLGWAAGAAAVAVVAGVLAFGQLHEGTPASVIFTPRWISPRAAVALPRNASDLEVGSDGTRAKAGEEYHLNLDFVARQGGNWRMTVRTSPGLRLLNAEAPAESGAYTVWQGPLDAGARTGLALMLEPTAAGTVQEIAVGFQNEDGSSVERMVFVPVDPAGVASTTVDWNTGASGSTLRNALEDIARTYGTPIVAPASLLDHPAAFQAQDANAGKAVQALADSQGLHFNLYNDTYNLF